MKKQLIIFLAALTLIATYSGCTSSEPTAEGGDQIAAEGSDVPAENAEGKTEEVVAEGEKADAGLGSPETVAEGNNLNDPNQLSLDNTAQVSDPNAQQTPAADPTAQAATPPPATNEATPPPVDTLANNPPPVETKPEDSLPPVAVTEAPTPTPTEAKPAVVVEYKKMETTPWPVSGKMMNTVYFARPGDTLEGVSEKIYGDKTHVKELKKANKAIAKRNLRAGDKIYYNSPTRSDDSSKIITYYEDKGVQPQTYTTKEGDNLRTISKEFLGFKDAWKEVWASNSFDSNRKLDAGVEIKYWKEDTSASTAVVSKTNTDTPPPPDASVAPPPPPTEAKNELPPPPPDMPPPPPPDVAATPPPPPPPPPPPDMAPPPPPPDMAAAGHVNKSKPASEEAAEGIAGMDQDTIIMAAGGAVVLLALAIFMVRRKNKQREQFEQAMNETQVG